MSLSNSTHWVGNKEGIVKECMSSIMKLPKHFPIFKLAFLNQKMHFQYWLLHSELFSIVDLVNLKIQENSIQNWNLCLFLYQIRFSFS